MACSDFSVRPYSYDDVPYDYELKHFSLVDEDVKMKVGKPPVPVTSLAGAPARAGTSATRRCRTLRRAGGCVGTARGSRRLLWDTSRHIPVSTWSRGHVPWVGARRGPLSAPSSSRPRSHGFGGAAAELRGTLCPLLQIPLLHRASAMSRRPLSLYASPWTAPAWLKSNRDVRGPGTLRGRAGDKCHKTWANYFIKYCPLGMGCPRTVRGQGTGWGG